jgi:hypothetical protein
VAPSIRIRRLACSITVSTSVLRRGDRLQEVARQQGVGLGVQEVRPGAGGPLGRRVDPGLLQDLPDSGGRGPDPRTRSSPWMRR